MTSFAHFGVGLILAGLAANLIVRTLVPPGGPAGRRASAALIACCAGSAIAAGLAVTGVAVSPVILVAAAAGLWLAGAVHLAAGRPPLPIPPPPDEPFDRRYLIEAALEVSRDGVLVAAADPDAGGFRIVYANPAFERLTGYGESEAVGQSPSILYDDRPEADPEAIRAALRGGTETRVELPARRKDGSRVWAEWNVVPIAGADPAASFRVAILRDTTDRRQAEDEIRQVRDTLAAFLANVPALVAVADRDGAYRLVNPAWEAATGRAAADVLGRPAAALGLPPVAALGGGPAPAGRVVARGPADPGAGGPRHYLTVRFPFGPPDQPLVGTISVDVTDQVRAEEAVREQGEVLQNVMAHIPCGVYWTDRDLNVIGCNGRAAEDLAAGGAGPALSAAEEAEHRRVIETGRPDLGREEDRAGPDGRAAALLISRVPLRDRAGVVTGVLGLYLDVTERKRLEAQLQQASKLEALGRLAGGIAHDFNNLLTVIGGNAELIAAGAGAPGPLAGEIQAATDRGSRLIRQLLTFSRPRPAAAPVTDLTPTVADTTTLLERLLGRHVSVETDLAAEPLPVAAERSQLEQVVLNIAVNARDAMPEGGTFRVATRRVGQAARLAMTDSGCGMAPEVRARVFEPFFTTKGPDRGTGLGLATVYGIVKQAGGTIAVDSSPGRGTTFLIDLPLAARA